MTERRHLPPVRLPASGDADRVSRGTEVRTGSLSDFRVSVTSQAAGSKVTGS